MQKKYSRNCDWTIVGLHKRWASWDSYCYKLCFFGLEVSFWFHILKDGN